MTNSTYNLTRNQASNMLDISTRTLDRYIRSGRLTYKKVSNRVLLSQEEVDSLNEEINSVNQDVHYSDVIGNKSNYEQQNNLESSGENNLAVNHLEESLNSNFKYFFNALEEKDKQLEEKNKLIFSMQNKIGEYENKLKNTISLPEYNKEKENLSIEKERLELEKERVNEDLRKEKIKNAIYTSFLVFIALVIIFFIFI